MRTMCWRWQTKSICSNLASVLWSNSNSPILHKRRQVHVYGEKALDEKEYNRATGPDGPIICVGDGEPCFCAGNTGAIGLSLILFLIVTPFMYTLEAKQVAQHYVLIASLKAKTDALDPQSTFQEGQPGTLALPGQTTSPDTGAVPYITAQASGTQILAVALLIAPDGSILASSYPQRYPLHALASSLLVGKGSLIARALMGTEGSGQETTLAESSVYVVEPVWSQQMHPIGAIYVQFMN